MSENSIKLSPEAKKARRDYIREWRKKNPDKVRAYNAKRWEKLAAKTTDTAEKG